jgi:uncharacterized coiled-coil DUF342 family protein
MIPSLLDILLCSLNKWQLFFGLLVPFILGYLLRYFLDVKYRSSYQELLQTKLGLSDAELRISALSSELESLKADQKKYREVDFPELHSKVSELENSNVSLKSTLDKTQADFVPYTGPDIEGLKTQLAESQNSHNQLKEEFQNLWNHKTQLEEKLSGLSSAHENLISLQNEHEKLKTDYHQAMEEKERLSFINPGDPSGNEQSDKTSRLEALSLELENWKKEAENAKNAHNQDIENWKNEIDSLRSEHHGKMEDLKRESMEAISIHSNEADRWKKEAEESSQSLQSLSDKLNASAGNEESLKNELLGIQYKLSLAEKDLEYFNHAHPNLIKETDSLREQISSSYEESVKTKNRIQELERELEDHKTHHQVLQENLIRSENENSELRSSLEGLEGVKAEKETILLELHTLKSKFLSPDPALDASLSPFSEPLNPQSETFKSSIEHLDYQEPSSDPLHLEDPGYLAHEENNPIQTHENSEETHLPTVSDHFSETESISPEIPLEEIPTHHPIENEGITFQESSLNEGIHSIEQENLWDGPAPFHSFPEGEPEKTESFSPIPSEKPIEASEIHPFIENISHHPAIQEEIQGNEVHLENHEIQETSPLSESNQEMESYGSEEIKENENSIPGRNQNIYQSPNYYFRLKGYNEAEKVYLVGDFENWNQTHYLMHWDEGEWLFPIHLEPGKYLYKFIVDGEWILDPANYFIEENEYGTGNSVVIIK